MAGASDTHASPARTYTAAPATAYRKDGNGANHMSQNIIQTDPGITTGSVVYQFTGATGTNSMPTLTLNETEVSSYHSSLSTKASAATSAAHSAATPHTSSATAVSPTSTAAAAGPPARHWKFSSLFALSLFVAALI